MALVAATTGREVLAILQVAHGARRPPDQEAYVGMMRRIAAMLNASNVIEGYARNGAVERSGARRALAGLATPLAADAVALDVRARPSYVRPALEVGMGVGLLLAAVAWRRHGAAAWRDRAPATTLPDETVPPRRIPPALLLNLGPSAEAGDLEGAPPLGTRRDVSERLAAIIGALTAGAHGHAVARGPDWVLTLDPGREDPVWTIAVDARGDGSVSALERLARDTGWQIYVPKLGVFVDPRQLARISLS